MSAPAFKEGDRVEVTMNNGSKQKGTIDEERYSSEGESYVVRLDKGGLEWRSVAKLKKLNVNNKKGNTSSGAGGPGSGSGAGASTSGGGKKRKTRKGRKGKKHTRKH